MLILWLCDPLNCGPVSVPGLDVRASVDGLVEARAVTDLSVDAQVWLVPEGYALADNLVAALATSGRPALVCINGLGEQAIDEVLRQGQGQISLLFQAGGIADLDLAEQLVWLKAKGGDFAVAVSYPEQAVAAILGGARTLIVSDTVAEIVEVAGRLVAAARPQGARPLSAQEIDAIEGREMCLTVKRAVAAGTILEAENLAVAHTETRGLSPILARRVAGLRLAYGIEPGEPLHFAHLGDPKA